MEAFKINLEDGVIVSRSFWVGMYIYVEDFCMTLPIEMYQEDITALRRLKRGIFLHMKEYPNGQNYSIEPEDFKKGRAFAAHLTLRTPDVLTEDTRTIFLILAQLKRR